jgi:hypothetical protein
VRLPESITVEVTGIPAVVKALEKAEALREAAQALMDQQTSEQVRCDACGGTGVAWDWPEWLALRAALQPKEAAE